MVRSGLVLPPLAPITATFLLLALVVENCLATAEMGFWNLENILRDLAVLLAGTGAATDRTDDNFTKLQIWRNTGRQVVS